eukprot:scaffold117435_cov21-Tisochrysis_lutea.AAC.2
MDKVAQVLAFYARHRASDPKYASPFAYAAFQVGADCWQVLAVVSLGACCGPCIRCLPWSATHPLTKQEPPKKHGHPACALWPPNCCRVAFKFTISMIECFAPAGLEVPDVVMPASDHIETSRLPLPSTANKYLDLQCSGIKSLLRSEEGESEERRRCKGSPGAHGTFGVILIPYFQDRIQASQRFWLLCMPAKALYGPSSQSSLLQADLAYMGGKLDDITVVVA